MISRAQRIPTVIGVGSALLAFIIAQFGWLDGIELKTLDFRFRFRGSVAPQAPIVLVSIDQDSFDELQLPWPWPRTLHADLVRRLAKNGAKIIGLDILFTEPKADPLEDHELGAAIKKAGNVVLGAEYTEVTSDFGPRATLNLPIPELRDGALGYGLVNVITDKDGIVRYAQPSFNFQKRDFPSFAFRIQQSVKPRTTTKDAPPPYLINFRGPARTYATVPYYRVLRDEIDASFFNGKIVLVGAFAASLHDVFPTPFSARDPTAGVEIQANSLETLLINDPIGHVSDLHAVILFCVLSALTIWTAMRLSPFKAFAVVFVSTGFFVIGCIAVFIQARIWVPITPAVFGIVVSYGGLTLHSYITEQRERLRYRAQFMKYVSPEVVEEILQNREGLALGGKRRHITVLFADVRGFTSISERIGPEQVVSFLDEYFAQVTRIVFKYGGTIDKFMGDGVMAIFGAPKSYGDDAARAVKTGLEMIEMVETRSEEWTKALGKAPTVGVGVNTGDAVVGRIGSELRSDYTAIGDTVNLASRLEALTKELAVPLLVSETTIAEIEEAIGLKPLQRVKVVGRAMPLLVYTLSIYADAKTGSSAENEPYLQRQK